MRKAFAIGLLLALLGGLCLAQVLQSPPYKPGFPGDPAMSSAEAGALGYMRTVVMAQRVYFRKHGHYAESLAALVGHGSFTKRMVNTDRGDYHVTFHGGGKGYSVALTPKVFAPDRRAFFVDPANVFHVEPDKPATADSPILEAGQ